MYDQISCLESIDTFKIAFAGKNSIDAELHNKTVNDTIELVKASSNAISPNCFYKVRNKSKSRR